jgi:hypothetical protein
MKLPVVLIVVVLGCAAISGFVLSVGTVKEAKVLPAGPPAAKGGQESRNLTGKG